MLERSKNMKKYMAFVLALVLLLGLAACGKSGPAGTGTSAGDIPGVVYNETGAILSTEIPEEQRYGGVLNTTWSKFEDNFDPHKTTGWVSYNWNNGVYENPLARDENNNFVPCVCEFELSEDMLELTMWVREGLTFHNGDPVDIHDVVASIDRSMRHVANMKKFFAPFVAEGYPIVEGEKVTYRFTEFNINTLYHFSHWATWCAVMPKEILDKYGDEYINQPEDCIGTGPYKLASYQTNAVISLERYDGYVPTTLECGGYGAPNKAYMDKINVWINPDDTSVTMSLINGDYDKGVLPDEYEQMADQYGLVVTTHASQSSICAMAFNTKNPDRATSKDANLRKAIAAALDAPSIAAANGHLNYEMKTCPMIAPAYANDIFDNADYVGEGNMELAKEYLAKSAYNGEEVVLLSDGPGFSTIWEDTLKELGINAKVEYMDSSSLTAYALENSNPYDCITFAYESKDTIPCQLSVTPREKYWGSAEKDRLFDEITKYPAGSEESVALWTELSELWVEECSVVNFYSFKSQVTINKDLVYALPGLPFSNRSYWVNPAEHMD